MYDARPNKLFGDSNLLFGVATLVVVGGCFAGVLLMPGQGGGEDAALVADDGRAMAVAAATNPEALNQAMDTADEQRLMKSLLAVSPGRYVELQRTFASEELDEAGQTAAVQQAVFATLTEHADVLTYASAASLNRVIDGAIRDLSAAQQSGTEYCRGSTYSDLAGASPMAVTRWINGQDFASEAGDAAAVRMQADLLDLVRQAQTNPARHGLFTKGDEAELQRVMMDIMTEPSVLGLMTSGGNDADALNRLNLCVVGVKALTSLRALPDETKGRAWAAMLNQPRVKQAIRSAQQQTGT